MAYRDEREALQARSRDLEQELERKRREVDELRRDGPPKERVEKLARDLAAAQWELARLRGTPPPRRVPVVVVALSGLIVALLLAGPSALMLMRTLC